MKRRRGITLIEVLVAIFIMSIGLLALLTLFPLGALRMSAALQDDRTGASASAGANGCDAFNLRNDPSFYNPATGTNWFLTPPPSPPPSGPPLPNFFPPAAVNGGGYPVYVDPYGVNNGSGAVGGPLSYKTTPTQLTPGIPRVSPLGIPPPYLIINPGPPQTISSNASLIAARYFTLPDDITFANDAIPDLTTGNIQKGGRYTWAYLLHRSQPGSPTSFVDLTIVVYAGRATQVPGGEFTYAALGATNDTSVTVTHLPNQPPSIRRGTWVLDTSFNPTTNSVNGDFYRVVSVTTINANSVNLELQTPLAKAVTQPPPNGPAQPIGMTSLTVLDNVADVFSRGVADSYKWEFHAQP
jgi:prepilin-type N-terminal cleavage/methylation domain-containing protein